METYEILIPRLFDAGKKEGFEKVVIKPDPKRKGMYKTTLYLSVDGYKYGYAGLWGKKNQTFILNLIKQASIKGEIT